MEKELLDKCNVLVNKIKRLVSEEKYLTTAILDAKLYYLELNFRRRSSSTPLIEGITLTVEELKSVLHLRRNKVRHDLIWKRRELKEL